MLAPIPNSAGVTLDEDLVRRIQAMAAASGLGADEVLRRAVDDYERGLRGTSVDEGAEGNQTVFDLMSRAGLIGCVDALPSDLSTSKAHMDGVGGG